MSIIKRRRQTPALIFLCAMLAGHISVRAEQLPVKTYTTADGLARDSVNRIIQDSHGFLWFATSEGLSRFDGYRFTNYGPEQGLPNRVHDLLETKEGVLWIATEGGLFRFNPNGVAQPLATSNSSDNQSRTTERAGSTSEPMFVFYYIGDSKKALDTNALFEDHAGVVWCTTDEGLYRIEKKDGAWKIYRVEIGMPGETLDMDSLFALTEGADNSLWIGAMSGLYRLRPNGRPERYTTHEGLPDNHITSLLLDSNGHLWAGTPLGLCLIAEDPEPNQQVVARVYTNKDGLLKQGVDVLFQTSKGKLLANSGGLCELDLAAPLEGQTFRCYTRAQGVSDLLRAFAEDSEGNLWIGTTSEGVEKLERNGFVTYREADGLSNTRIASIFENRAGGICTIATDQQGMDCFDGKRFNTSVINLPQGSTSSWGWYQVLFQDSAGDWWVPTSNHLFRYADNPGAQNLIGKLKATYTSANGLTGDYIFRLYEDSRGDIWIGTITLNHDTLNRWERSTNTIHSYTRAADGVPLESPTAFREDRAGNVWIGYYEGDLVRYRNGRFDVYRAHDGLLEGMITGLTLDHEGRLWVATTKSGLWHIDDPTAETPRFDLLTTANGLSSNQLSSLIEDRWGRLYIGSGRGIDQLDPATGHIRHYTVADGLPDNFIDVSLMDREGTLWFGTLHGLARFVPEPENATHPPPVMLSGLRISGIAHHLSELGVREVPALELNPDQNQLQIDFFSIGFGAGESLRYQYMLEGADRDWSQPTAERAVSYARLAPGAYRFLVRAVNAEGVQSLTPASITFTIWPPVWQRWWFLTLAAILVGSIVIALDRYRANRMKELDAALTESKILTETLTEQRSELRKANRVLELEYEVTSILAEAATPNEAAPKILEAICKVINWDIGVIWNVDEESERLRCQEVWPSRSFNDFSARTVQHTFAKWQGLPGRVWASGEAQWTIEPGNDTTFNSIADRAQSELKSAFGFPITLEGEVIGVLEFFSQNRRELDPELLEMMSNVGAQIGQLIERKQAEEALLRAREERLRELERVRTRIATDLHDDIGASLTQIVILSEVAQATMNGNDGKLAEPLTKITTVSNELVEAMSDIVWAINPKKDHLSDLLQRMRRFASDIFSSCQIHFSLRAPHGDGDIQLGANVRRELFLIFKESVNNIARHSGCTEARIEFYPEAGSLVLKLSDNGKGFDVTTVAEHAGYSKGGNGLISMRRRAEELGGSFEIDSKPGEGTSITLKVPLGQVASFESPHPNGR